MVSYSQMLVIAIIAGLAVAAFPLYGDALKSYLFPTYQASYASGEGGWRGQGQHKYGEAGERVVEGTEEGATFVDVGDLWSAISQIPAGELSEAEKEGILYMREEEKLARDVYLKLYEIWGLQIFRNIADSEQTHMYAVKLLISRYNLEDPAPSGVGKFSNPTLQELYYQLVELGSKSLEDALKVGAMIEEIDIVDLKKHINETDNQDIILVYENLMKGSRNHLRAFVSQLESRGIEYAPQYLSPEEYQAIISTPIETGNAGAGQGQGAGLGGSKGHGKGGS